MATAFHALSGPFSATVAAWAKGSPNRKNWTVAEANRTGFVLDIPFRCKAAKEIRDLAKLCGARFDGGTKSWSVAYSALTPLKLNTLNCLGIIKAAIPAPKASYAPRGIGLRYIVLAIPFEEKDRAKAAGARWSAADKFWYMTVDTSTAFRDALLPFEDKGWVDHAKTAAIATKCGVTSAAIAQQYTPLTNRSTASKCVFAAPQGTEYFRQAPLRRFRHTPKGKPVAATPKPVAAPSGSAPAPARTVSSSERTFWEELLGRGFKGNWAVRALWKTNSSGEIMVQRWAFCESTSTVVVLSPKGISTGHVDMRIGMADGGVNQVWYYTKEFARTAWAALISDGWQTVKTDGGGFFSALSNTSLRASQVFVTDGELFEAIAAEHPHRYTSNQNVTQRAKIVQARLAGRLNERFGVR